MQASLPVSPVHPPRGAAWSRIAPFELLRGPCRKGRRGALRRPTPTPVGARHDRTHPVSRRLSPKPSPLYGTLLNPRGQINPDQEDVERRRGLGRCVISYHGSCPPRAPRAGSTLMAASTQAEQSSPATWLSATDCGPDDLSEHDLELR